MVKIEDLLRINLLKDMPYPLLQLIADKANVSIFGADTRLITMDEKIDTFYMLIMGQVAVKKALTPEIDIILDYIQSGASFGASAFIKGAKASYTAICQEPCELITISGEKMFQLFKKNDELAYYIMMGVARQYKSNMDTRAQMILKTLGETRNLKDDINDIELLTVII